MTRAPIRRENALFRCPFCETPHVEWHRTNGVKTYTAFYVTVYDSGHEWVYCRSCKGELYNGPARRGEVQ